MVKQKHNDFRNESRLFITIAWTLSLLPFIPTLTETWGRHGLECRTRKCAIINLFGESQPRTIVGNSTVIVNLLLLILFNTSIYFKLRVKRYVLTHNRGCLTLISIEPILANKI